MAMFVNQLKLMRTRKGFTQEQVAELVGVSRQAVAKWEKGETLPDIESCIRLSDLYGIPLDALVRGLKEEKETGEGQQMFGIAKMNDKGQIEVDSHMRTSVQGIYAIGDVIGGYMLAHAAYSESDVAVDNILGRDTILDESVMPRCIYTLPPLSAVIYRRTHIKR